MAWSSKLRPVGAATVAHSTILPPEPYYMQVLKTCDLDDATGDVRAVTRYSLNGEDLLWYQSDQNRWFSVHPVAWQVAEHWNREGETLAFMNLLTPQQCRFWIESSMPFTTKKTGDSSTGAPHSRPAASCYSIPSD
uniref:MHC class II beta chain N-terminal domain-containing protein n=1 Tax=Chelonoidis abingdonii TaxID=106734 RepID=A0A8C0IWE2_CHEAB